MEFNKETVVKMLERAGYISRINFYDGFDYIKNGFRVIVKNNNFSIKSLSCYLLNNESKLMSTDPFESYLYNNVPLIKFLDIVLGPTEKILMRIQNELTMRVIDGLD